jgi:hypothetical protein
MEIEQTIYWRGDIQVRSFKGYLFEKWKTANLFVSGHHFIVDYTSSVLEEWQQEDQQQLQQQQLYNNTSNHNSNCTTPIPTTITTRTLTTRSSSSTYSFANGPSSTSPLLLSSSPLQTSLLTKQHIHNDTPPPPPPQLPTTNTTNTTTTTLNNRNSFQFLSRQSSRNDSILSLTDGPLRKHLREYTKAKRILHIDIQRLKSLEIITVMDSKKKASSSSSSSSANKGSSSANNGLEYDIECYYYEDLSPGTTQFTPNTSRVNSLNNATTTTTTSSSSSSSLERTTSLPIPHRTRSSSGEPRDSILGMIADPSLLKIHHVHLKFINAGIGNAAHQTKLSNIHYLAHVIKTLNPIVKVTYVMSGKRIEYDVPPVKPMSSLPTNSIHTQANAIAVQSSSSSSNTHHHHHHHHHLYHQRKERRRQRRATFDCTSNTITNTSSSSTGSKKNNNNNNNTMGSPSLAFTPMITSNTAPTPATSSMMTSNLEESSNSRYDRSTNNDQSSLTNLVDMMKAHHHQQHPNSMNSTSYSSGMTSMDSLSTLLTASNKSKNTQASLLGGIMEEDPQSILSGNQESIYAALRDNDEHNTNNNSNNNNEPIRRDIPIPTSNEVEILIQNLPEQQQYHLRSHLCQSDIQVISSGNSGGNSNSYDLSAASSSLSMTPPSSTLMRRFTTTNSNSNSNAIHPISSTTSSSSTTMRPKSNKLITIDPTSMYHESMDRYILLDDGSYYRSPIFNEENINNNVDFIPILKQLIDRAKELRSAIQQKLEDAVVRREEYKDEFTYLRALRNLTLNPPTAAFNRTNKSRRTSHTNNNTQFHSTATEAASAVIGLDDYDSTIGDYRQDIIPIKQHSIERANDLLTLYRKHIDEVTEEALLLKQQQQWKKYQSNARSSRSLPPLPPSNKLGMMVDISTALIDSTSREVGGGEYESAEHSTLHVEDQSSFNWSNRYSKRSFSEARELVELLTGPPMDTTPLVTSQTPMKVLEGFRSLPTSPITKLSLSKKLVEDIDPPDYFTNVKVETDYQQYSKLQKRGFLVQFRRKSGKQNQNNSHDQQSHFTTEEHRENNNLNHLDSHAHNSLRQRLQFEEVDHDALSWKTKTGASLGALDRKELKSYQSMPNGAYITSSLSARDTLKSWRSQVGPPPAKFAKYFEK